MNASYDFSGKNVIVTGASRGIGYAIAKAFCESGANVIMVARGDTIEDAGTELKKISKGNVVTYRADLSVLEERKVFVDFCDEVFDRRMDVLVNNAGIQKRHKPEEFPVEDFNQVLNVNLVAVFDLCRLVGSRMLVQGKGSIINLASMLSFFGGVTVPAYAASKGGVAQLTKALSNDWAYRGIRVNAIAPGYIDTEMNTALIHNEVRYKEIVSRIPAGAFGRPEDIAGTALFLASESAAYVSGAVIPVDGGYLGR